MDALSQKEVKFYQNGENSVLSSAFVESHTNDCYAPDVVLKIGPEKYQFSCHRLVLAAASPFLAEILSTTTPGTMPVILLPDVNIFVVEYVLTFLYYGEVHVPTSQYSDFVETCKLLELRGETDNVQLIDVREDESDEEEVIDEQIDIIKEEPMDEIEENSSYPEHNLTISAPYSLQNEEINFNHTLIVPKKEKRAKELYITRAPITPQLRIQAKQRLMRSLERAYTSLGIPITERIDQNIKECSIVVENGILVRGTHVCGVCEPLNAKVAHLRYKIYSSGKGHITFMTDSFKLHLKKKHLITRFMSF